MANEVRKIGQYELKKVLGKGGMATVYLASQPLLDREVAVKVMLSQFSGDEDFMKRFNQEARAIARLRHPYILTVFEYGLDNGQPYLVTEYMDGGTLREFMQRKLDLRQISRIISQVADALDYANTQGMVHRDIKPSNIFMGKQRVEGDRAVLGDFGIVKLVGNTNLTQTGMGIGTPEYMSPEQGAGEALDGRSDEYSLAIVLYEMLAGVTPFKADTPLAIMMGHVNRPVPDPRTFNPSISDEVTQVLKKALSKFPHERYDTAGEFSDAFAAAAGLGMSGSAGLAMSGSASSPTNIKPTDNVSNADATQALPVSQSPQARYQPNTGTNQTLPGGQAFVTVAQAYELSLKQERDGNRQAAFETMTDIYRREPGYRDVAQRLKSYQNENYQYTGQYSMYKMPVPGTNSGAFNSNPTLTNPTADPSFPSSPTMVGAYAPADPTQQNVNKTPVSPGAQTAAGVPLVGNGGTPTVHGLPTVGGNIPVATAGGKFPLIPVLAGVGTLLVAGILAAVFLLGGNKVPDPTATVAPAITSAVTPGITSVVTTGTATTGAITGAVTTANVTTIGATPVPTPSKPDPVGAQALALSKEIYSVNGDLKVGIDKLETLARANKDSWVTQRELGRAYYWYARNKGGVDYLKEATSLNDKDALSFAYLGMAYSDIFDDAAAVTAILKATQLDGNNPEVQAASAITLLRSDPKQAKEKALAALKADPENLLANWAGWASFVSTSEFGTALPYLDKLIGKYPKIASFTSGKGYHFQLQGNIAEAEVWYNKALQIDPDFPFAHTGLGQIARLEGRFDDAIKEYNASIKAYPLDINALIGLGYTLDAQGKSDDAEAQFRKVLQIDRKSQEAYNGLAFSYISRASNPANKGNKQLVDNYLNQAVDNANQAISLAPNYADAHYQKGYALILLEKFTPAEEPLKRAVELDDKNPVYHFLLGFDYFKQKNNPAALREIKRALELDPNLAQAKELLKQLGG